MRFIQAANLKLGTPSDPAYPWTRTRADELEEDLLRLIDAVRDYEADALFLTGNVFCAPPSEAQLDELDDLLHGLKNVRTFILPGELDSAEDPALMRSRKWASSTRVFAGDVIDRVYVPRWETEITGVGFTRKNYGHAASGHLPPGTKGAIQILLLPFIGAGYRRPLTPEMPGKLPFDYVGTGQYLAVEGSAGYPLYSPGCFEPDDFTEQSIHGFLAGELTADAEQGTALNVRMIRNARREYLTIRLNSSWETKFSQIRDRLKEVLERFGKNNVYRVIIEGDVSPSTYYRKNELCELGNIAEIVDPTTEEKVYGMLQTRGTEDPVGRYISGFKGSEKALRYGIDALIRADRERGS